MTDTHALASDRAASARHLAARAIMALRAGFPVESITLHPKTESDSGIVCDWKSSREAYADDVTLLRRAFAFVYIGTILDQANEGSPSEELANEIKTDQAQSQQIREVAVDWGVAASVMETNPFAHVGFKLASQIARLDRTLIDQLATKLLQKATLERPWLVQWYGAHVPPRSLRELEESGRY